MNEVINLYSNGGYSAAKYPTIPEQSTPLFKPIFSAEDDGCHDLCGNGATKICNKPIQNWGIILNQFWLYLKKRSVYN
jgi:hypothetical protein